MDEDRQACVARAARRAGSWLLADEAITDVALDVPVPPPFSASVRPADADAVLVCGSLGKSLWGGLRIGWLRGPERVIHELAAARAALDLSSPVLDQLTAAEVLGNADEYAAAHRERLREQRAVLMRAVDETFPAWTYRVPAGGLCLWLRMDRDEATPLAHRAQTHGVLLHSGPRFGADAGTYERFIRLPYAQPPGTIVEAVRRIAMAHEAPGPRRAADHRADLVA
jgi:DNA-binding transcriptional MocR family regulator